MKKHFKLSLNQKPKLRLQKEAVMNDITNQQYLEFIGLIPQGINCPEYKTQFILKKDDRTPEINSSIKIKNGKLEGAQEHNFQKRSSIIKMSPIKQNEVKPTKQPILNNRSRTLSGFYAKKSTKTIENTSQLDQYRQYFQEIQLSLRQQDYTQNIHTLSITLKHQKLFQIILNVVKVLVKAKKRTFKDNDFFSHAVLGIKNQYMKTQSAEYGEKICLASGTLYYEHSVQKYWNEMLPKIHKVEDLNKQIKELELELTNKKESFNHMAHIHAQKLQQVNRMKKRIYEIEHTLVQAEKKLKETQNNYVKVEINLALIEEKYEQMAKFITTQENSTILKQIIVDFKQIESEIFEYAAYLQSNQLANDVHYEPRPFTEIEEQINEELKAVISIIDQEKDGSGVKKCSLMKGFITDTMRKFRNKDKEMLSVCQFRAKCILTFVKKMKRWLNNWQLKQQYLVNLKKEFVCLTERFNGKMGQIFSKEQKGTLSFETKQLAEALDIFKQLQQVFYYGNAFY